MASLRAWGLWRKRFRTPHGALASLSVRFSNMQVTDAPEAEERFTLVGAGARGGSRA